MTAGIPTRSIRGSLILVVMLISTSTLVVALGVSHYFDYKSQHLNMLTSVKTFAAFVANQAQDSIVDNQAEKEMRRLSTLTVYKNIDAVQIYQLDPYTQQLSFFAGYTRSGVIPNNLTDNQLRALLNARQTSSQIELSRRITYEGELIGFAYFRYSMEAGNKQFWDGVSRDFIVLLIASTLALFAILRLQRSFSQPIDTLIDTVQRVDIEKNFKLRAPKLALQELDYLASAFNRMLARIERRWDKQQQAEQEVRTLNQNLEEKVAERTQALKQANAELLQTLEKLHLYQGQMLEREKLHRLGEMVAGISHELNTPLGLGITTSSSLQSSLKEVKAKIESGELSHRQMDEFIAHSSEAFNILERNLKRASDLLESFKHVAVDQCSERDRSFNLHHFIHEVLLTLKPKLKSKQHIVEVTGDSDLEVVSKPGALSQILINLVNNSLLHGFKHIEQGTISIATDIQANSLVLTYEDNGCGMSKEISDEVFSPYFTTEQNNGGSGLGMYIVQSLVQQVLGGEIELRTEPGQGIWLKILVPLADADQ
ncbi:sensor histidine kinase [Corallincola platygyrae]|uniref:histidine kinase n=2 Tax=Corallincola platygyrae TaxID=1193278 RepID=A0ABW4XMK4_9GAMM